MLSTLTSDLSKYLALAVMLLAVALAYFKGRDAASGNGQSTTWTYVPLIAFVIASIGPSVLAIILYLAYKSGLVQPGPAGFHFSSHIRDLPIDFAIINWGFIALYVACRLWPHFGSAKSAMWFSVVAMAIPNIALFFLAPEMVSNVFDAGQGIGVVLAMLSLPIVTIVFPGTYPGIFDAGFGIGFVISAIMAPIPFFGLIGWLAAQLLGWIARTLPEQSQRG